MFWGDPWQWAQGWGMQCGKNGSSKAQVLVAVDTVVAMRKAVALAVLSVYGEGEGRQRSIEAGIALSQESLAA